MGLADEVRASNDAMPPKKKLPWILVELGETNGRELLEVIADPTIQPVAILRTLRAKGFDISLQAVGAWCRKARE